MREREATNRCYLRINQIQNQMAGLSKASFHCLLSRLHAQTTIPLSLFTIHQIYSTLKGPIKQYRQKVVPKTQGGKHKRLRKAFQRDFKVRECANLKGTL